MNCTGVFPQFLAGLAACFAWAGASGCTRAAAPPVPQGAPIVFIHGFKGSELVDAGGHVHWITALQALGLETPALALPTEWQGETQARDGLAAREALEGVRIVPWLVEEKAYGPWLEAASGFGHPFYSFAYDWRRDNLETSRGFEAYLDGIRARHPGLRIQVVAHSMGGLIALSVLNRRPELFDRVVFAGVPFRGGVGFLLDMHAGTKAGLNGRILSPAVLGTFPSVYALFPEDGHGLLDPDGSRVSMDFYSASDWIDRGLGSPEIASSSKRAFLEKALQSAKSFRSQLDARAPSYPPILDVIGAGTPTLSRVVRGGPKSVRGWDFETAPREPGDGRVLEADAALPDGIQGETLKVRVEHSTLLNDPEVIRKIRDFLR